MSNEAKQQESKAWDAMYNRLNHGYPKGEVVVTHAAKNVGKSTMTEKDTDD